tara:strand:+ start:83584 stop:86778 length:3195 start_codon:yes stop_codon:yes gene_type:complete
MKKVLFFLSIVFFVSLQLLSQSVYQHYQDGKIWFQVKSDVLLENQLSKSKNYSNSKYSFSFIEEVKNQYGITSITRPFPKAKGSNALLHTFLLEFSSIHKVDEIIQYLESTGKVVYAEKVPYDRITYTPNDPNYNSSTQWGLFQINAGQAWNVSTGNANIIVATVDNAIETGHPDLTNQIWTNSGEIPNNGVDDDGNGYIDDVNGFDVGDNDNDLTPPNSSWDHGTHVAGITGATTDNNIGVASIGFGITIMPVKATANSSGANSVSNGYDGIYYAALNGAHVINCSWGGYGYSTTAQNIINWAWNQGSIIVAAAGNDNNDMDLSGNAHYPSNYNNVICVASSTTGDAKSSFSNYGSAVDVTAPGSNIASTVPFGSYAYMSGTSMASPMVSGLLGLMISLNPGMPQQDIVNCLISSCDNINAANPSYIGDLGSGRINAFAAMNCVSASLNNPPVADFSANYTTITAGGSVTFTDLSTYNPTSWSWNFDNQNLGGVTPSTFNGQTPPAVTYANPGTYEVALTVSNANGSDTEIKTAYITVDSASSCEIVYLDTNGVPFHFGWTPTLYSVSSPGGGYVAGVNSYDDVAKAEYFTNATTGAYQYLVGTYIWFGKLYSANTNKTVDINVWDGTGGTPGSILATKTMTIAELQAGGSIPFIEFDNAVPIPASGEIFVGIDFSNLSYTANDTLAIVTNASGESPVNTAWEKWNTNTWHAYSETNSWGISLSHYIMPWLTNDTTVATITASATTICEGDIVNFDATGSTFQDTLVWTFFGGSPNSSTNVQQSVAYNNAGTYTAYLEVIGGGCSLYDIDSVSITVNPTPVVTISASADSICLGSSVTITAGGANTYLWTPGGQTTPSITTSPTNTTTYTVTGTSSGCSNVNSVTIYVTNTPVANATYSPMPVCPGQTVTFDGTSSINPGTYTWYFPAGSPSVSSANGPFASLTFNTSGTHPYSLIVSNACGSDTLNSTFTIDVCTGVNKMSEKEFVNAFFTNSNLILNTANLNSGNYQLKLFNGLGQLIYDENLYLNDNNQSIIVETNNLSKGLYFVHLQNKDSQFIIKLIK